MIKRPNIPALVLLLAELMLYSCSGGECDDSYSSYEIVIDTAAGSSMIRFSDEQDIRRVMIGKADSTDNFYGFTISDRLDSGYLKVILPDTDSLNLADSRACLYENADRHDIYMKSSEMLEWEIVLNGQPESNRLIYTIDTEYLIFYYQQPDTFEAHRLDWQFNDDIPGSYAVYHMSGDGVRGKAFHIYCPSAWDSSDDTVRCEIDIDTTLSLLTLIIPETFIENAVYPIVVDPAFGYTDKGVIGAHLETVNFSHRVNYDDPYEAAGELLSAHICAYRTTPVAACTATVIVYSYDSTPGGCDKIATGDKIAITNFGTGPEDGQWISGTISGMLTGDDDYIVSWQGREDCNYCLRVCADYTGQWGFEQRYDYTDWGTNDSLSGYSANGYRYSVYVQYEEGSGQVDSYIRSRKIRKGF